MRTARGVTALCLLGLMAWGAEPRQDCTGIESDIARAFQSLLRKARSVKAPPNACALGVTIRAVQSDRALDGAKEDSVVRDPVDFNQGYDFYLRAISDLLSRPFYRYNLGYAPKRANNKNSYHYRIGPPAEAIAPHGVKVFAKETIAKEHSAGSTCGFKVDVNIVWLISLPQNSVSGLVKEGKGKPLKKGRIRFMRKGPNNGEQNSFEAPILNGAFQTEPKLPSGHYRIELIEPKACQKLLDDDWIFLSGHNAPLKLTVECESREPFFVVDTDTIITQRYKPTDGYRGATETLETRKEIHNRHWVYIDEEEGRILQYHPNRYAYIWEMEEYYELDTSDCLYKKRMRGYHVSNVGGDYVIESPDAGWGFEEETPLTFKERDNLKGVTITWGALKKSGRLRKTVTYRDKLPDFIKQLYRRWQKSGPSRAQVREMMAFPLAMVQLEPDRDFRCDSTVTFESFMVPLIDPTEDPKVTFTVSVRPATAAEKARMKRMWGL